MGVKYALLSVFVLLVLFGCVNISTDSKQKFLENGNSSLTINEYAGVGKNYLGELASLGASGGSYASTAVQYATDRYYNSSAYPAFLCKELGNDPDVSNCAPNNDGSVTAEVNLTPGEFYTFDSKMDWVNLKEVRTYRISKIPLLSYFVTSSDPQYQSSLTDDMNSYIKNNIDSFFTKSDYCTAQYPFDCDIKYLSGDEASVRINTSDYYGEYLNWVACSNSSADDFQFYNSSDILSKTYEQDNVNLLINSDLPRTVTLKCPPDSKSIVVSYNGTDIYGNETPLTAEFQIQSKDQMEGEAISSIGGSSSSSISDYLGTLGTGFSTTNPDSYVIDLQKGTILGHAISSLSQSSPGLGAGMIDLSVTYEASFPDAITSADIGGTDVSPNGNDLQLTLADFENTQGAITVTTEKQLSPLGVYTWILLAGIIILVMVAMLVVLFLRRDKG